MGMSELSSILLSAPGGAHESLPEARRQSRASNTRVTTAGLKTTNKPLNDRLYLTDTDTHTETKSFFFKCSPFLWSCRDPSKQTDLSISVMYISKQHCSWMKSLQISGWISPSSGLQRRTAGSSSGYTQREEHLQTCTKSLCVALALKVLNDSRKYVILRGLNGHRSWPSVQLFS